MKKLGTVTQNEILITEYEDEEIKLVRRRTFEERYTINCDLCGEYIGCGHNQYVYNYSDTQVIKISLTKGRELEDLKELINIREQVVSSISWLLPVHYIGYLEDENHLCYPVCIQDKVHVCTPSEFVPAYKIILAHMAKEGYKFYIHAAINDQFYISDLNSGNIGIYNNKVVFFDYGIIVDYTTTEYEFERSFYKNSKDENTILINAHINKNN